MRITVDRKHKFPNESLRHTSPLTVYVYAYCVEVSLRPAFPASRPYTLQLRRHGGSDVTPVCDWRGYVVEERHLTISGDRVADSWCGLVIITVIICYKY